MTRHRGPGGRCVPRRDVRPLNLGRTALAVRGDMQSAGHRNRWLSRALALEDRHGEDRGLARTSYSRSEQCWYSRRSRAGSQRGPGDDKPHSGPSVAGDLLGVVRGYLLRDADGRAAGERGGVWCTAAGRRLYVVTAPDSWKARQIRDGDRVAVTVLLRRGGLLSLLAPIPPATISFRARVTEHPAGSLDIESVSRKFASRLPQKRRAGCVLELIPEGTFLTYGVGVSLRAMMDPDAASVPHSPCDGVPTERAEPCVLARRRMKLLSAVRVQIRGLDLKIVDLKIAIFTAPGRPHWDRSWLCGNTFVHQPTPPPRASRATLRSQRSSPGALTSRSMTRSPSRRALRNVRIRSSGRCRGRKALARCGVLRA
jgi:hypothetical protein